MAHVNIDNGQQVDAPERAAFFLHDLREISMKYGVTLSFSPGIGYILNEGYYPSGMDEIAKCAIHGFAV